MKTLLSTTSLVVALGFPDFAQAQATPPPDGPETPGQVDQDPDFLSHPGQPNIFGSELMGHDVYARRPHDSVTDTDNQPYTGPPIDRQSAGALGGDAFSAVDSHGRTSMHLMGNDDPDELINIGQVSEIVLDGQGQLFAIAVDVGEFFETGTQDVVLTMEQLTFSYNPDDLTQMHIVLNAGPEMADQAPEFDRMAMRDVSAAREHTDPVRRETATPDRGARQDDRDRFIPPPMQLEDYRVVEASDVTVEMLMGRPVYDVNHVEVGTVQDLNLDAEGVVTSLIVEFGGFLGIGTSQASLDFAELTILAAEGLDEERLFQLRDEVLLFLDATREQIEELPHYSAEN